MLLLSSGMDDNMGSALMLRVEEAALQLYRRPYLAWGVPERTLILLHALLRGLQESGIRFSSLRAVLQPPHQRILGSNFALMQRC